MSQTEKNAGAVPRFWALGVLLYEMLAGRRPFSGRTPPQVALAILRDDPPPMGFTDGRIPPAVEEIIHRCLEKNPEERFHSAHDLALAHRDAAVDLPEVFAEGDLVDQLLDLTQGREGGPFDRSIDVLIGRLRKRLGDDAKQPELIKTVRGRGYLLASKVSPVL